MTWYPTLWLCWGSNTLKNFCLQPPSCCRPSLTRKCCSAMRMQFGRHSSMQTSSFAMRFPMSSPSVSMSKVMVNLAVFAFSPWGPVSHSTFKTSGELLGGIFKKERKEGTHYPSYIVTLAKEGHKYECCTHAWCFHSASVNSKRQLKKPC